VSKKEEIENLKNKIKLLQSRQQSLSNKKSSSSLSKQRSSSLSKQRSSSISSIKKYIYISIYKILKDKCNNYIHLLLIKYIYLINITIYVNI